MNGNKSFLSSSAFRKAALCGLALLCAAPPAPVRAQSAPALSGVTEIVVQPTRFTNPEAAQSCGLSSSAITNDLAKFAKEYGAPASNVAEAKPALIGAARVELASEITTLLTQDAECLSFVSAWAQTRNTMAIAPIKAARNVTILYWKNGLLVKSTEPGHARLIKDVLDKLARSFAEQYKVDQPADLSGLVAPPEEKAP